MWRRWISPALLAAMVLLLSLSQQAAEAVRQALALCAGSVIPSLFPFLVLSSLLMDVGGTGPGLQQLAGRVLGCSGTGAEVFLLSLLGGYPVGARLTGQLFRRGQLSQAEAEHLLTFCNNAGPAFILGLVGLGQFGSTRTGVLLYLIHAAAAALTALLRRPKRPFPCGNVQKDAEKSFPQALVDAVAGAGETMLQICAFVTFFYTVLQLLSQLTGLSHPLALGFLELTRGILQLPSTAGGFVMASALLAWGGLSVHCQTAAVLAGTGLSLRPYLCGKLCQTLLAAVISVPAALFLT